MGGRDRAERQAGRQKEPTQENNHWANNNLPNNSNNCCKQDLPMNAKISGLKFEEEKKQNLKVAPQKYLLTTKEKIVTLQWRNLADTTLTKSPRLILKLWTS